MKLAVLGGSFNPIHIGHLHLADSVLSLCAYDRLLIVPAHISPFKQSAGLCSGMAHFQPAAAASSADRLDLIRASISSDPRIEIDDLELQRGGISYTIDSIKEIISRYKPEGKPGLVLGDDLVPDFSKWKDADELSQITDIIIARRLTQSSGTLQDFPYPHTVIENEVLEISSASIRQRIADGLSWQYLVPEGARQLIKERGLFLPDKMVQCYE